MHSVVVHIERGGGVRALGRAAALGWVLAVAHLHAGERHPGIVPGQHLHDVDVPVAISRVVIAGRQLRCVRAALEPPVHPGQLHSQVAGRHKFEDGGPAGKLQAAAEESARLWLNRRSGPL